METLTCPNCGMAVDPTAEYCPNRGLRRGPPPAPGYPHPPTNVGRTVWQVVSALLFFLIGVPAALFGGCMLILAGGSKGTKWDANAIALVYGPIAVSIILLILFIMSFVKRKK